MNKTEIISDQNDRLRSGDSSIPGRVLITSGLQSLIVESEKQIKDLVEVVSNFDAFEASNDPRGERDFGQFDFEDQNSFWKIDLHEEITFSRPFLSLHRWFGS